MARKEKTKRTTTVRKSSKKTRKSTKRKYSRKGKSTKNNSLFTTRNIIIGLFIVLFLGMLVKNTTMSVYDNGSVSMSVSAVLVQNGHYIYESDTSSSGLCVFTNIGSDVDIKDYSSGSLIEGDVRYTVSMNTNDTILIGFVLKIESYEDVYIKINDISVRVGVISLQGTLNEITENKYFIYSVNTIDNNIDPLIENSGSVDVIIHISIATNNGGATFVYYLPSIMSQTLFGIMPMWLFYLVVFIVFIIVLFVLYYQFKKDNVSLLSYILGEKDKRYLREKMKSSSLKARLFQSEAEKAASDYSNIRSKYLALEGVDAKSGYLEGLSRVKEADIINDRKDYSTKKDGLKQLRVFRKKESFVTKKGKTRNRTATYITRSKSGSGKKYKIDRNKISKRKSKEKIIEEQNKRYKDAKRASNLRRRRDNGEKLSERDLRFLSKYESIPNRYLSYGYSSKKDVKRKKKLEWDIEE